MKILIYLIPLIIISIILVTCNKTIFDGFVEYKIKKGNHYSTHKVGTLTSDTLLFHAKFDKSAQYKNKNPANQYDINKLYGFSDCNQTHHKNSARFGWHWINGSINIVAYVYNNGERVTEYITSVNIGEVHTYEIIIEPKFYKFRVDNDIVYMDRTNKCERGLYYRLYPYFGGDEKAPHDITIMIKEDRSR